MLDKPNQKPKFLLIGNILLLIFLSTVKWNDLQSERKKS